jgi:hypothetical protein
MGLVKEVNVFKLPFHSYFMFLIESLQLDVCRLKVSLQKLMKQEFIRPSEHKLTDFLWEASHSRFAYL